MLLLTVLTGLLLVLPGLESYVQRVPDGKLCSELASIFFQISKLSMETSLFTNFIRLSVSL